MTKMLWCVLVCSLIIGCGGKSTPSTSGSKPKGGSSERNPNDSTQTPSQEKPKPSEKVTAYLADNPKEISDEDGKSLFIEGTIHKIQIDPLMPPTLIVLGHKEEDKTWMIKCYFPESAEEKIKGLQKGLKVKIKGEVSTSGISSFLKQVALKKCELIE